MRIEFVHAQRPAHSWPGGIVHIGAAADNDLCLEGRGVADHHVVLHADVRGLVLEVCAGAGHVYVNARPVRERALLRRGDSLGIGACHLRLVADGLDEAARDDLSDDDAAVCQEGTVALRAVAGPLSGQVHAIVDRLALGAHGPVPMPDRPGTLSLQRRGRRVWLDGGELDPARPARVNGLKARHAWLDDGDQLVLGTHRYVVDISIRAPRPAPVVAEPPPSDPPPPARRGVPAEMWLVVTAAGLALVLAGVLLLHF